MKNVKKKNVKRGKQNKKSGDIKKEQKGLSGDVAKEQVEELPMMLIDNADTEQRRANRLGAIIAILVVLGTLCAFIFKMTISSINVWSEHGIIYWYLQLLFLSALSTLVILFVDMILYVVSDLKRHNIMDKNYQQYDEVSDKRYMHLINDFSIYIILLFIIFCLYFPISVIYEDDKQKWNGIVASCGMFLAGVLFLLFWIREKGEKEIKLGIKNAFYKFANLVFVALGCYVISVAIVVNNKTTIEVNYNADGRMVICNTSTESYNGLDIEIRKIDGEMIYVKSFEKKELLFAREDKYINNEFNGEKMDEGLLVTSEWLHWKCLFDLKEAVNEPGEYYVSIIVHNNGKRVQLINSFLTRNNEYFFAKDSMVKEY